MKLTKRDFLKGGITVMGSVAIPTKVVKGQTDSNSIEIEVRANVTNETNIELYVYEDINQNETGENLEAINVQTGTHTYICTNLKGTTEDTINYWLDIYMSTENEQISPRLYDVIIYLPEPKEPTSISLLDRSFSTGKSILLAGVYILLGYMTIKSRSGLGFLGWAFSLIALILSIVLGLDMLYVWGSIALAIIMFLISLSLTPWGVKA